MKAEPRSSDLARQEILERYRALTSASASAHARARASLAGGTTGNLRYFQPYPMFFATGDGSSMVDLDGRRLLVCFLCNGPLLLGHRHPSSVSAVRNQEPASTRIHRSTDPGPTWSTSSVSGSVMNPRPVPVGIGCHS